MDLEYEGFLGVELNEEEQRQQVEEVVIDDDDDDEVVEIDWFLIY